MGSSVRWLVASLTALSVCASLAPAAAAASAAPAVRPRIGNAMGIVPAHGRQEIAQGISIPVVYHGGQVMRGATIHTVFWAPSGYAFSGPPSSGASSYKQLVQQYLTDLAHDSGTTGNSFSVLGQYPDGSGPGTYGVSYDPATDSIDDTNPYPPQGQQCSSPAGIGTCVTDLQIQRELDRVIASHGPGGHGLHDVWMVLLPPDVDTCDAPGSCGTNVFAGYHALSNLGHGPTVYAVIIDPLIEFVPPPGSDPQGNPEAEVTLDTVAHEAVEAITDPEGAGWMDPNGFEVGDKCEAGPQTGTPLGFAPDGSPYNQVVNGHQYLLQTMWSNADQGCKQRSASTASALPLPTINLQQFSSVVSGNIANGRAGVPVEVLLARGGNVVAGADGQTGAGGAWSMTLTSVSTGDPRAVGDDRDEILVRYGAHGPPPDLIQTGNGGNPFSQSGWTGWFALDHGYAVRSNSILVGPCSQVGVLAVNVAGRQTAPPIEQCETETNVAVLSTGPLGAGTPLSLSSQDNRAVTVDAPNGALVKLTIGLGEPGATGAMGNNQILFNPTGFPSCTAELRLQSVRCLGLVPGARYTLARRRGHATLRARADDGGVASFSGLRGAPGVQGGDVLTLRNQANRTLTTLHVAHLRVNISGSETVVSSGHCEPDDYYGPPLSTPPISGGVGINGVAGLGTVCPPSGRAARLSTANIEQVDDMSGGLTKTEVPFIRSTAPSQDATLYGPFVALAQTSIPGPNESVIPTGSRVALTIRRAGSRHIVFRAANVATARGVGVRDLSPGSYAAMWVLSDSNGDTRTIKTQFVQEG